MLDSELKVKMTELFCSYQTQVLIECIDRNTIYHIVKDGYVGISQAGSDKEFVEWFGECFNGFEEESDIESQPEAYAMWLEATAQIAIHNILEK